MKRVETHLFAGRSFAMAAILALNSTLASAAAVTGLAGGSNFPAFNGTNQTIGWSFTVTSPNDLTVTSLGFYDPTANSPLSQSHLVGIWSGDGTSLLGSVTVQVNSAWSDSFRYASVTPFVLTAGLSYLIGAAITDPFTDVYTVPASVTTDPAIALTGSARNGTAGGFSAPTTVTAGSGRFGPNFEFAVNSLPEPSTLPMALAGLGLGLVCAALRARSATAA